MKSKFDYNEQDPRWSQLLDAEALLKSIRDGQTTVAVVDNRIEDIKQIFIAAGDYSNLSAKQVKELLTSIAVLVNG
jgi:coproporphyrinogen III oxidase-like Fe-S oxidoreductase